jgi:thymidine kinase
MSKLYFRYGAMGCGKTMQLLQVAFNYEERGQKVAIMKPALDTKASNSLETRIGLKRPANFLIKTTDNLLQIVKKDFAGVSCVLVDEAQFLTVPQVEQLLQVTIKLGIPVMCYGLRTDRLGELWPGSARLLALAQDLDEIRTICDCGKKATMTGAFINGTFVTSGPQNLIDDGSSPTVFRAFCAACWYRHHDNSAKPN